MITVPGILTGKQYPTVSGTLRATKPGFLMNREVTTMSWSPANAGWEAGIAVVTRDRFTNAGTHLRTGVLARNRTVGFGATSGAGGR